MTFCKVYCAAATKLDSKAQSVLKAAQTEINKNMLDVFNKLHRFYRKRFHISQAIKYSIFVNADSHVFYYSKHVAQDRLFSSRFTDSRLRLSVFNLSTVRFLFTALEVFERYALTKLGFTLLYCSNRKHVLYSFRTDAFLFT